MGIGPCIADLSICLIVHIGQLMSLKWSRQKSFMVLIPGGARVEAGGQRQTSDDHCLLGGKVLPDCP